MSTAPARAGVIFAEGWESPAIAGGTSSTILPANWFRFSGPTANTQVFHPNSSTTFDAVEPLASPAGGNQLLYLAGVNTGVYRMAGVTIQADTVYTLAAAIGNNKLVGNNQFWSLQLWADTNGSNGFEGSAGGDTFIGQQFGTSGAAVNPAAGEWAANSFTFDSAATPGLVGRQLVVFLNNYDVGTSHYDNVSLSSGVAAVPEPASVALLAVGAAGVAAARRRARRA